MALSVTKISGDSLPGQDFKYSVNGSFDWNGIKIRFTVRAQSMNGLTPTAEIEMVIALECLEANQELILQCLSPFLAAHRGAIWSRSLSDIILLFMPRCPTLNACMRETDILLVALDATLQTVPIPVAGLR